MKDNTILIIGGGVIAYALLSGGSSSEESGENSGSSQGGGMSAGAYGLDNQTLTQLQNSSLPDATKKTIKNIYYTINESQDTALDSIDVVGGNNGTYTYTSVRTSGGYSTPTTKKLAVTTKDNVTFIKNELGETQGAYDSIRNMSLTKKSAQTLEQNKNNPITNIFNDISSGKVSSSNVTKAPTKKEVKKEESFISKWTNPDTSPISNKNIGSTIKGWFS